MTSAAETQDRPRRMRRQALLFRIVNVPMRRILGLPFRTPLSKSLMLVHLTGRRTGKSYRQPVSYVRDGDTLLTPGGEDGHFDRPSLANAVSHGFRIVRWHLTPP